MSKYLVDLHKWDEPKVYEGVEGMEAGEKVVVECEIGNDLATIVSRTGDSKEAPFKILRRATERDIQVFESNNERKEQIFDIAHKEIKRMDMEMKLVDVHVSLEKNIIIAFTADGRVDFRQLVKNLSKIFQCLVRMRQIGSRDEARKLGGCGICGRELCCVKFPGSIPSISTEMAKIQQVSHRGSERISGLCGRLMCCLSYESEQYKKLLEGMPELHSRVRTKRGDGVVIEINAIKQEFKIKTGDNQIVTIKKSELK